MLLAWTWAVQLLTVWHMAHQARMCLCPWQNTHQVCWSVTDREEGRGLKLMDLVTAVDKQTHNREKVQENWKTRTKCQTGPNVV